MARSRIQRYFRNGRLSQLAVFEASARLGCYTRAARELHFAQPTVSAQIKKLTDALGVPLFEQVGRRMHPTEAGRCLQAACAEVIETFARLEGNLARLRGLDTGRLSIASGTVGGRIASRLVAGFARCHPQLEVALQIHNRQALLERMARADDDLYLFASPPREGVVSQRILRYPLHVTAPDGHPLVRRRAIPLQDVARETFVLRERGSGSRDLVESLFRARGLVPQVRLDLPSNDAIEEAVRAGAGLAILPLIAGAAPAPGLAVLDVEGFPLEGFLSLCYPIGNAPGPAVRAFLDFARENVAAG